MERYIEELKSVPRAPGGVAEEGLELPGETIADLAKIASEMKVPLDV